MENFGPKIKSPYSEIALFEFALFEDLLYTKKVPSNLVHMYSIIKVFATIAGQLPL